MVIEWLLITLLLAATGWLICGKGTVPGAGVFFAGLAALGLLGVHLWDQHLEMRLTSRSRLTTPHLGRPQAYATSTACKTCHPDQYASWQRSFHRTMTQVASPEAIRGPFAGVTLELDGDSYRLEQQGDEFWVDMVDPNWKVARGFSLRSGPNAPRVRRRVSMTTGSHHMQAYWLDNQHGNQQYTFPFTYLFEQERWVPRPSVFMRDPNQSGWSQVWNVGCVDCHSTAGQPRQKEDTISFDTRVAELGIACEACHGPAGEHVRLNTNPQRRYALHWQKQGDRTIVNPGRLSSKRSSEVCGRCHSVHSSTDEKDWIQNGSRYLPGQELEASVHVTRHVKSTEARKSLFWSDDMIRVSGREYNGLLKTPCFQKGELSCLSCHSMHQSSPTNQLAASMENNAACLPCHTSLAQNLEQHTHHPSGSSGSLCYNCHMPYTSYGLLKALRSHQISNPSVKATLQTGRPNACNLCHLDKTLDWTAQTLSAWFKAPPEDVSPENKSVAASILWTLQGDAGQRALMAWHMGWKPAQDTSHVSWLAPYLATLLADPYPAVRYIAGRSLQRLPGYNAFPYDYIAADAELGRARTRALDIWKQRGPASPNPCLLVNNEGQLETDALAKLLQSRNDRVVDLQE